LDAIGGPLRQIHRPIDAERCELGRERIGGIAHQRVVTPDHSWVDEAIFMREVRAQLTRKIAERDGHAVHVGHGARNQFEQPLHPHFDLRMLAYQLFVAHARSYAAPEVTGLPTASYAKAPTSDFTSMNSARPNLPCSRP